MIDYCRPGHKWIPCVIYRPASLLYHTIVDRKGILAGAILSVAHAHDLLLCTKACYYKFGHR